MEEDTSQFQRVQIARINKIFKKELHPKIEELTLDIHKITEKATYLFKLRLLEKFSDTKDFTHEWASAKAFSIDLSPKNFLNHLRVVSKSDIINGGVGRNFDDTTLEQIKPIYDDFVRYNQIIGDAIDKQRILYILEYKAQQLSTNFINNVFMHFKKYIMNCIRIQAYNKMTSDVPSLRDIPRYKWKKENKVIYGNLIKLWSKHLLNTTDDTTRDLSVVPDILKTMIPPDNFNPQTRAYNTKVKPQLFLVYMIYMTRWCEDNNGSLYAACPIQTTFVPTHFMLDTQTLVQNFLVLPEKTPVKEKRQRFTEFKLVFEENLKQLGLTANLEKLTAPLQLSNSPKHYLTGTLPDNVSGLWKNAVWMSVFGFPKKYLTMGNLLFNNKLSTNGYKASIHYCSPCLHGKNRTKRPNKTRTTNENTEEMRYITDLSSEEREHLLQRKLVFGDAGRTDLLTLGDGYSRKEKVITYSAKQRRYEMETYKSRQTGEVKMHYYRERTGIDIKQVQSSLGVAKSCYFDVFANYVRNRKTHSETLDTFYMANHFRRVRMKSLVLGRSSMDKFVHRIKKTLGEDITIIYGDWSSTHGLQNSEPTISKGLRKHLSRHFPVYLQDEYLTSKRCPFDSEHRVENVEYKENVHNTRNCKLPRTPKKHYGTTIHKVLRCPNEKCKSTTWNRDVLATVNMRIKARYFLEQARTHPCFSRCDRNTGVTSVGEISVDSVGVPFSINTL